MIFFLKVCAIFCFKRLLHFTSNAIGSLGDMKINGPSSKGNLYKGGQSSSAGDRKSSSTHELLDALRHQTPWKEGQPGYARGITCFTEFAPIFTSYLL